jgi:hypothetical protein
MTHQGMSSAAFAAALVSRAAAECFLVACSGTLPAALDVAVRPDLSVAVVPAVDSAGLFVALCDRLSGRWRQARVSDDRVQEGGAPSCTLSGLSASA